MSIVVCQEKNTYLHYFIFPLNFPGLLKSEGGQDGLIPMMEKIELPRRSRVMAIPPEKGIIRSAAPPYNCWMARRMNFTASHTFSKSTPVVNRSAPIFRSSSSGNSVFI